MPVCDCDNVHRSLIVRKMLRRLWKNSTIVGLMVVQFTLSFHQLLTSVKLAVDSMKWGQYLSCFNLIALYGCKICHFGFLSLKDMKSCSV